MPVIDRGQDTEIQMRPGIRGRFVANKELGASQVGLLINTIDPGVNVPLHTHTVEEGFLILRGTLWVRIGEERYTAGRQHTVIIPPGTPHAWGTEGTDVAEVVFAFGGPDPFGDAVYLEGEPPKQK